MMYVVIEIQDGFVGQNVWAFNDLQNAESKYHSVLAVAATSSVACHAAVLLNESGYCIKHESYKHEAKE